MYLERRYLSGGGFSRGIDGSYAALRTCLEVHLLDYHLPAAIMSIVPVKLQAYKST